MYSKEEAFQIRKKFWTSFGQYMKLQKSIGGQTTNWVNYKTGIKDLHFKTDVDNKSAWVAINMIQKDMEIQELMYEQFEEFQLLFDSYFESPWNWQKGIYDPQGNRISKIEIRLENVSIFRENDWPAIIRFLKDNLLRLDEFWNDTKESFEIFK